MPKYLAAFDMNHPQVKNRPKYRRVRSLFVPDCLLVLEFREDLCLFVVLVAIPKVVTAQWQRTVSASHQLTF